MPRESSDNESNLRIYEYLPQKPVDMAVILTVIGIAFYYIWRLTYLTPWYDELYTYYYFISNGPIYSAIHWPLPNNHVGFSVLSAFLDYLGNSYFGLRGLSFFAALMNLFLVYRIGRRFLNEWTAYAAMLLYFACLLVNDLAVQGRGYTLATTCFLLTVRQLSIICRSEVFILIDYIVFAIALILGLYVLPSSIYWVIPTCLAAGLFLIINGYRTYDQRGAFWDNRYFRRLKNCLVTGIISAVVTFVLYLLIWLAIGSNLLVKDETTAFFGQSHVLVILKHPLKAALTGIDYMLSQPYIQSVSRNGYMLNLYNWLKSLAGYMYPGFATLTMITVILAVVILLSSCIMHFENSRTIFNLIVVINLISVPILLIIQAKLPYYRVFSYTGFLCSMSTAIVAEHIIHGIKMLTAKMKPDKKIYRNIYLIPMLMAAAFTIFMMTKSEYHSQYGKRETDCYNALYIAHPSMDKRLCVLDCDQQLLLKFGWRIECDNTDVTDCEYILADKNILTPGYDGPDAWKLYLTYDTMPWEYVNSNYYIFYENEEFVLYKQY